jgi:hypothetical protein
MDGYMSGVYGWSYRALGNGMKLLWGVVSQINGSTPDITGIQSSSIIYD